MKKINSVIEINYEGFGKKNIQQIHFCYYREEVLKKWYMKFFMILVMILHEVNRKWPILVVYGYLISSRSNN